MTVGFLAVDVALGILSRLWGTEGIMDGVGFQGVLLPTVEQVCLSWQFIQGNCQCYNGDPISDRNLDDLFHLVFCPTTETSFNDGLFCIALPFVGKFHPTSYEIYIAHNLVTGNILCCMGYILHSKGYISK